MNNIDWDDLRIFLALARSGSLSAAARLLNVEHSTVARRLTRLEGAINCKLFNRMARGWTLTQEGLELEVRTLSLESQILFIEQGVLQTNELVGKVLISVPPALLSSIIVPLLDEFMHIHPKIDLSFVGEVREADLSRGEADIALRMTEPVGAELVTRVVGRITYGLYGTRKWLEVPYGERQFIGFMARDKFLLANKLDEYVGSRRYSLRTNDIHVAKRAAAKGLGIALIAKFFAKDEADLVLLDGLEGDINYPVSLVMQRDVRQSPRVRVVADFIAQKLASIAL